MLLLLVVLWMGAKGVKDRSYLAPRGCVSPFDVHRRECLARNSGPGPFSVTFLSNFSARDQWWEAPGGHASVWTRRPKTEDLAGIPRRSPSSRLACARSQVSPGRSGTPATFAPTRARSWRTRFQLRSASRSSGQDAGLSGQAGRLAPRPAG